MSSLIPFIRRLRGATRGAFEEPSHGTAEESRRSAQYGRDFREPSEDLREFRLLVGIYQDQSLAPHGNLRPRERAAASGRPAPNLGLYTIVYDKEMKCKKNYKRCSVLVNACLGLQIIFAAALTAIGASDGSRGSITILGAFNTIMASILTFLKGSGLPNRLRYFQHEWATLRDYIEQKERDLMMGYEMDVRQEVETIRKMYEEVKHDVESSTPERFASSSGGLTAAKMNGGGLNDRINRISQLLEQQVGNTQRLSQGTFGSAMKGFNDKRGSATTWINEERTRAINTAQDQMEKGYRESIQAPASAWISQRQTDYNTAVNKGEHAAIRLMEGLSTVKSKLGEKMQEVHELEKGLEQKVVQAGKDGAQQMEDARANAARNLQAVVNTAASDVNEITTTATNEAREAVADVADHTTKTVDTAERSASHVAAVAREHVADGQGQSMDALRDATGVARGSSNTGQVPTNLNVEDPHITPLGLDHCLSTERY